VGSVAVDTIAAPSALPPQLILARYDARLANVRAVVHKLTGLFGDLRALEVRRRIPVRHSHDARTVLRRLRGRQQVCGQAMAVGPCRPAERHLEDRGPGPQDRDYLARRPSMALPRVADTREPVPDYRRRQIAANRLRFLERQLLRSLGEG
jgi:hypothetical protein